MKTQELDFELPSELIAKKPVEPRDSAKLLVVDKNSSELKEGTFAQLPDFLKPGDLLVFNETKVFPARLKGKKETGGQLEVLFLQQIEDGLWEVLVGGKVKEGDQIIFPNNLTAKIKSKRNDSVFLAVNLNQDSLFTYLEQNGEVPLPPYLKREAENSDQTDYQTIFAKKIGSAAAPTASLHFTNKLLQNLKEKGIESAFITLHVGLGTFAPVKTENLEDHPIHTEYFEVSNEAVEKIKKAKKEGGRVVAVGTTVARTLETLGQSQLVPQKGETNIFIYPGFKFQVIDGLITNFHTPKSSLLGLVYAFLGQEKTQQAYQFAIEKKYRFYSYGDGMLII